MVGILTSIHRGEVPLPLQGVSSTYRSRAARAHRGKAGRGVLPILQGLSMEVRGPSGPVQEAIRDARPFVVVVCHDNHLRKFFEHPFLRQFN